MATQNNSNPHPTTLMKDNPMYGMRPHEYADDFPELLPDEYEELKASIAADGLIDPITVLDYQVLDGRHRYRACRELNKAGHEFPEGRHLRFIPVPDGMDPWRYVLIKNLHRRHMTSSQRARIVAKRITTALGSNQHTREAEGLQACKPSIDREEAAEIGKVSTRLIDSVKRYQATGVPELDTAVADGNVTATAAEQVAKLPEEQQRQVLDRAEAEAKEGQQWNTKKAALSVQRDARRADVTDPGNFPEGKYFVIYADPPWRYDGAFKDNGNVEDHYATMSTDDICGLEVEGRPVQDLTDKNAVLYLWTTAPKLLDGLQVLKAWGFEYRQHLVWHHRRYGLGLWLRGEHELLLIGVKGNPGVPPPPARWRSVLSKVLAPWRAHSKKPAAVYSLIESQWPDAPKIELFARNERPGWKSWGNQVGQGEERFGRREGERKGEAEKLLEENAYDLLSDALGMLSVLNSPSWAVDTLKRKAEKWLQEEGGKPLDEIAKEKTGTWLAVHYEQWLAEEEQAEAGPDDDPSPDPDPEPIQVESASSEAAEYWCVTYSDVSRQAAAYERMAAAGTAAVAVCSVDHALYIRFRNALNAAAIADLFPYAHKSWVIDQGHFDSMVRTHTGKAWQAIADRPRP